MIVRSLQAVDPTSWLTVLRAPALGPARLRALLEQFSTPTGILKASHAALMQHGLAASTVQALKNPEPSTMGRDLRWLEAPDHHLITWGSPDYPGLLAQIPDPPMALVVAGDPLTLSLPQLAIVGSRNPTPSGRDTAFQFARHLSDCGFTITSGLALGIDSAAHRGALAAGGKTVAVCGTGLDVVYPRSNATLFDEIAARGALISEYPLGTEPRKANFPQRNRIISGLSLGTVVVEAAARSGSLITARLASEQGREAFAIPGSIHNPLARGCHRLIRQGAKLVESAQDIIEELGPLAQALGQGMAPESGARRRDGPPGLDADYKMLLDALGFDPAPVDRLVEITGLTSEEVSSMLLILELNGLVAPVPGGAYIRVEERG